MSESKDDRLGHCPSLVTVTFRHPGDLFSPLVQVIPHEKLNAIPESQKATITQRQGALVRGLQGCFSVSSVCSSRRNMNLLTRVHRMTTNMNSFV